jgi:hypothetical protein
MGIPIFQIEIERIFPLLESSHALCKCCFQIENIDKSIFVNKNCPLDPCITCYKHFNLASACEVKFDLTKELEAKFDDGMEHEEFSKLL